MARYLQVAQDANTQIKKITENHGAMTDDQLVKELAYLYNLGIRTAPRAVQSTVRLNAVQAAIRGYAVRARLERVESDNPKYKDYNKLVIEELTTKKENKEA